MEPKIDLKNMIKGLINPISLYFFIKILITTIYRIITIRFFNGLMIQYPANIRMLAKRIPNYKKPEIKKTKKNFYENNLKLAIDSISFNGKPNWTIHFDSHEQYVSLHRWNWLLREITDKKVAPDFDWGMSLIRSWLNEMGPTPKGSASESYTVGERISNTCLFARHIKGDWDSVPNDIKDALRYKTKFLSKRLEYIPGNLTGNHLINNARALLLSGYTCDIEFSRKLARTILKENLRTVIDNFGFLREGSSHYQFLITRWLLEIRLVAEENNDIETLEIIKKYIPNMLQACHFFLIKDNNNLKLPLFGDISPDCEPEWLLDIHKSNLSSPMEDFCSSEKKGWASLYNDFQSNSKINWNIIKDKNEEWFENNISGWYKLVYLDWTAIWHIENPSGPSIASHAHHDAGSLVLYRDGKEVLIDSGRFEYDNNILSNYGFSACSHSTLTINNYPMMMSRRDHRLHQNYKKITLEINSKINPNSFEVSIEHNGFRRIPGNIDSHKRVFNFSQEMLTIEDSILGSGRVNINSYFQLPMNQNDIDIKFLHKKIDLDYRIIDHEIIGSLNPIGGWRFTSFGKKEKSISRKFELFTQLPCTQVFKIIKLDKQE